MSEQREALAEDVERLCEVMHDAYEAAAQAEGWETQERSRKPWADVPEANKATMRAAVSALLDSPVLARLLADAEQRGADEGVAALLAAAEQCQFPVPPRVSLREDNGYVSMTTLRLCAAALTTGAADRVHNHVASKQCAEDCPSGHPSTWSVGDEHRFSTEQDDDQ